MNKFITKYDGKTNSNKSEFYYENRKKYEKEKYSEHPKTERSVWETERNLVWLSWNSPIIVMGPLSGGMPNQTTVKSPW